MNKISSIIDEKINHFTWVLVANGFFLLILAVLIVWTDFMLQLIMGLFAVVVAFVFLYSAYKLQRFKKVLEKYLKF